jgi:hypothetical protein
MPQEREAVAKAQEERTSWKDRSRARTNEVTGQQLEKERKEQIREDGAPSTSEAEKKVELEETIDKGKGKEVEVQVPATQSAPEKSITESQW